MKIYREEKEVKKSWCLELSEDGDGDVSLCAVDSKTGKDTVNLIIFLSDGRIVADPQSFEHFGEMGYDPHEHNNSFDEFGAIVISHE